MNYSKKLRRTALAKRVVFMIVIAIVLGLVVGGVSGYALKTHIAAKDKEKGKIQTDGQGDITPFVYGAYDDRMNHEQLTETLGVTDYLDPYQNIRAGVFTLRKLFERYQDTDMVLMAYNMGENAASCLWGKGMFKTDYTQSILTIQKQFNDQLEGD